MLGRGHLDAALRSMNVTAQRDTMVRLMRSVLTEEGIPELLVEQTATLHRAENQELGGPYWVRTSDQPTVGSNPKTVRSTELPVSKTL